MTDAARAVRTLHRPLKTDLGPDVLACEHCTELRQVHIIRWPCPTVMVVTEGEAR